VNKYLQVDGPPFTLRELTDSIEAAARFNPTFASMIGAEAVTKVTVR
jgi:hypothetical protein